MGLRGTTRWVTSSESLVDVIADLISLSKCVLAFHFSITSASWPDTSLYYHIISILYNIVLYYILYDFVLKEAKEKDAIKKKGNKGTKKKGRSKKKRSKNSTSKDVIAWFLFGGCLNKS